VAPEPVTALAALVFAIPSVEKLLVADWLVPLALVVMSW
jgi:hypothetical protein